MVSYEVWFMFTVNLGGGGNLESNPVAWSAETESFGFACAISAGATFQFRELLKRFHRVSSHGRQASGVRLSSDKKSTE